jgi:hypothetical protein
MPVESLPELAAYRELILEVAKRLYFRAHSERRKVPDHFDATFRLILGPIEDGSTVETLVRLATPDMLAFPPGWDGSEDFFERARAETQAAIDSVGRSHVLTATFPIEAVPMFNAFGRGLHRGEELVVAPPGSRLGAIYNKEVRKKVLLLHRENYEDDVELVGVAREADLDLEKFHLRTDDGRRIPVRCSPLYVPLALRGMSQSDVRIRVKGLGLRDKDDRVLKVLDAIDVSFEGDLPSSGRSCSIPIDQQLDSLLILPPEWFGPTGHPFSPEQVEWLKDLLVNVLASFKLPVPFVYPMPGGGARAEWPTPEWEIAVEIEPATKKADLFAVHLSDDAVSERTLDFARAGAESTMGRFLVDHLRP